MIVMYGIVNMNDEHTDVSKTLLGAKQYATRNDHFVVSKRVGYNVEIVACKWKSKWYDVTTLTGRRDYKKALLSSNNHILNIARIKDGYLIYYRPFNSFPTTTKSLTVK